MTTMTSNAASLREGVDHANSEVALLHRRLDQLVIHAATLDVGAQYELPYTVAGAWISRTADDNPGAKDNLALLTSCTKEAIDNSVKHAPAYLRVAMWLAFMVGVISLTITVLMAVTTTYAQGGQRTWLILSLVGSIVVWYGIGHRIHRIERVTAP